MSVGTQIKLYDRDTSPNCQRVKIVLGEKKLSFEAIPVDLKKKEQKRPEFLKLNPYGKVPVLIDGDTVIYESCIINEYLEEKYPKPPLMPTDPALRAKIRIMIDFGVNHIYSSYSRLRDEMMKPESSRDSGIVSTAKEELRPMLARFEQQLDNQPYLAGEFSLLDAAVVTRFLRMEMWGLFDDSSFHRMRGWFERMKGRQSVQSILPTVVAGH